MTRPHHPPAARLFDLPPEDREMFARCSARELLDHAEWLRQTEADAANQIAVTRRRRQAVESFAIAALQREGHAALLVRRADGAEVHWRPHADGRGFERTVHTGPARVGPAKPDAGAG